MKALTFHIEIKEHIVGVIYKNKSLMIKISYYLKDKHKEHTQIICNLTIDKKCYKFSTKITVVPDEFKPSIYENFNDKLLRAIDYCRDNLEISTIKLKLFSMLDGNTSDDVKVLDVYKSIYERIINTGVSINGLALKSATINSYKNSYRWFNQYIDAKNVEYLDEYFLQSMVAWMKNQGLRDNSIINYASNCKVILVATAKKLSLDESFTKFNIKKDGGLTDYSDKIFLTELEINKLENYTYKPNTEHYKRYIHTALICYYTGQRFSDVINIKPGNVMRNDNVLKIKQIKTGSLVAIPLSKKLDDILMEYNDEIPAYHRQNFNTEIKKICKEVGIKSDVSIQTDGVYHRYKKYELVSSHTFRRSFATNLYLGGVSSLLIKSLTGHKTEESFLSYLKADELDIAKVVKTIPFFNS